MALTRKDKEKVLQDYLDLIKNTKSFWLVVQKWVDVNDVNLLRKWLYSVDGKIVVVRKRLFLMALAKAWYENIDLGKIDWVCVFVGSDDWSYKMLTEINKMNKFFKKEWKKWSKYSYLWWVIDGEWKDGSYIEELATLPSKEELIWKLLFLMKYPMQSLAFVLDKIKDKK